MAVTARHASRSRRRSRSPSRTSRGPADAAEPTGERLAAGRPAREEGGRMTTPVTRPPLRASGRQAAAATFSRAKRSPAPASAASMPSSSTSRCVTKRTDHGASSRQSTPSAAEALDQLGGRHPGAPRAGEHHVGLHRGQVDVRARAARPAPPPGARARRWSSARRATLCSQRVQAAGGDDAGLAHAAAVDLAGARRQPAAWRRPRPAPSRPARPRPFDRQMLTVSKGAAYSAGAHARGRHGVEQPGAVEVHLQAVPVAELAHGQDVLERQHDAAAVVVRLLEAHEPRRRPVHVGVGVDVLLHLLEVERAVRRVEDAQLHLAERRRRALLVEHDVRLGVQEDLVAAPRERAHGRLVAHACPEGK